MFFVVDNICKINDKYLGNNCLFNDCSSSVNIISIWRQINNSTKRNTDIHGNVRNCSINKTNKTSLLSTCNSSSVYEEFLMILMIIYFVLINYPN